MFNEANIELLNIKKNILKYINDIRDHRTKTIDNDTNKKIKIDKSTNKKVTRDKSTNKKKIIRIIAQIKKQIKAQAKT